MVQVHTTDPAAPWNPVFTEFLVESNRIEGIKVDPDMIELFVTQPAHPVTSGEMRHAQNSVRALLYGYTQIFQPMNLRVILEIHSRQMKDLLSQPGMLRHVNVTVGGDSCPAPGDVPEKLKHWFELYNAAPGVRPGWNPMRVHCEFELIHPFVDGNGRVGRVLWMMDMIRRELPPETMLDQFDDYSGKTEKPFLQKRDLYYETIRCHRAMKANSIRFLEEGATPLTGRAGKP